MGSSAWDSRSARGMSEFHMICARKQLQQRRKSRKTVANLSKHTLWPLGVPAEAIRPTCGLPDLSCSPETSFFNKPVKLIQSFLENR